MLEQTKKMSNPDFFLAPHQICIHTGTCTHRQTERERERRTKKGFHCLPHSQRVLNGRVVLTWRNSFRAREMDTITPPSIIALGGERESPIGELERCGADRWIDSLKAEAGRVEKGMTERTEERQTAGHRSD